MARKMAIVGFLYLAGLFFAPFLRPWESIVVGGILGVLAVLLLLLLKGSRRAGALALLCFCGGFAAWGAEEVLVYSRITALDGTEAVFSGNVLDIRASSDDRSTLTVQTVLAGKAVTLTLYADDAGIAYGDTLSVRAKLTVPRDKLGYAALARSKAQGILLTATALEQPEVQRQAGFSVRAALLRYRDTIRERIARALPNESGALLIGVLFGDTGGLSPRAKVDLFRSGIGHAASVSGLHLAIVAGFLSAVLAALRVPKRLRGIVLLVSITAFTVFAGMAVSAIRSAVMLAVVIAGGMLRRKADTLNSIGFAALLVCLASPYAARDAGFLLSVLGTIGVGVAGPSLLGWIHTKRKLPKAAKWALDAFIPSLCATVCTFPMVLLSFDEVSLLAPLTNVLLLPLCSLALLCAVVFALAGGSALPGAPLLLVGGLCCKGLLAAVALVGKLRFAYAPLGSAVLLPWVILTLAGTAFCLWRFRAWERLLPFGALCALLLWFGRGAYQIASREVATVDILSDGTGTALVIQTPESAALVQLQGRGISRAIAAQLRFRGIEHLAAFVLPEGTSPGELPSFAAHLEGIEVGALVAPEALLTEMGQYRLFEGTEKFHAGAMEIALENGYTVYICAENVVLRGEGFSLAYGEVTEPVSAALLPGRAEKVSALSGAAYTIAAGKGLSPDPAVISMREAPVLTLRIAPDGGFSIRRQSDGIGG